MDRKEMLQRRVKARRLILFSKEDPEIAALAALIDATPRRAVVLWALEFAEESANVMRSRYPGEDRPMQAVAAARMWAAGEIRMPLARKAILACHALAKELSDPADIARCHAIGQACATVHANGHAIGFPLYDLTALIRENGTDGCDAMLQERISHYVDRLQFWQEHYAHQPGNWAGFL